MDLALAFLGTLFLGRSSCQKSSGTHRNEFFIHGHDLEIWSLHCVLRLRAHLWNSLSLACPVSLGQTEPWGISY